MKYTVAIRTLGKAGNKYQQLLNSLASQTIPPTAIYVYIAKGYAIPKETIGIEQYVYVDKGMVAQRALPFDEINSEYILLLDDDLYLPSDFVARMFEALETYHADVVSADIFPNSERPFLSRMLMLISGRMMARSDDGYWGYKVMRNGGYSYNINPRKNVYFSQTNAGATVLCKKQTYLQACFDDELWLDKMPYALGEDQVLFYKMFLQGRKVLTLFHSGIEHLDGGNTLQTREKERTRIYCDFRFKTIFWHRFIYLPEKSWLLRQWDKLCIGYAFGFGLLISLVKGQYSIFKVKKQAIKEGISFIKSEDYKELPPIKRC